MKLEDSAAGPNPGERGGPTADLDRSVEVLGGRLPKNSTVL
jgi:hypothetical protein